MVADLVPQMVQWRQLALSPLRPVGKEAVGKVLMYVGLGVGFGLVCVAWSLGSPFSCDSPLKLAELVRESFLNQVHLFSSCQLCCCLSYYSIFGRSLLKYPQVFLCYKGTVAMFKWGFLRWAMSFL